VRLNSAEERSFGARDAEQEKAGGYGNAGVYAILDAREDGDEHAGKEHEYLDRGNFPVLIHHSGRGDQITHSMNDEPGETAIGNVEEDRGQGIESAGGRELIFAADKTILCMKEGGRRG
jgi:hypothetical protein